MTGPQGSQNKSLQGLKWLFDTHAQAALEMLTNSSGYSSSSSGPKTEMENASCRHTGVGLPVLACQNRPFISPTERLAIHSFNRYFRHFSMSKASPFMIP